MLDSLWLACCPCHIRPIVQFSLFYDFLSDYYDITFNLTSIFDRSKVSLIVQMENNLGY